MRWLSLWLCVILTGQHALAQETLINDPRLQTRITVWLKMEPLRDTLRAISKQTGVPLRCQDALQHHKVSVFVENRPAGEILTQLASLFRYAWRKDGEGYVLYVPDETRLQEESVLRAAREARVRALRDVIRFAREAIKNEGEVSKLFTDDSDSQASAPFSEWNRRAVYRMRPWHALREYAQRLEDPSDLPCSHQVMLALLAKMPPQAERGLLNGQLVGFSTRPALGVYPMPADIVAPRHIRGFEWDESSLEPRPAQQEPTLWGIWIRHAEGSGYLECRVFGFPENKSQGEPALHRDFGRFVYDSRSYLRDHRWLAHWQAWATPQNEWEKRIPERALTERDDRPKPQFPSYVAERYSSNDTINSADLLEWFAWSTRLPVMSESFRTDMTSIRATNLNAPRDVLRQLADTAWVRLTDTGYVLRRVQFYWERRVVELPEDWLRPLEQRFAQQRWLDLEDYVALAGRMNNAQADYYNPEGIGIRGITVRFPVQPLIDNLRGFRFLASLSAAQRHLLLSEEWIPAERLTLPQRQRFQEALGDYLPPPERLMVVDFPYLFSDDSQRRVFGYASYTSTKELPIAARAAFRLRFYRERPLWYRIYSEDEPIQYYHLSLPHKGEVRPEQERMVIEAVLRDLKASPSARPQVVCCQGYTLELQAPPAQRKIYYIFQQRAEPTDVRTLEAKLKELEKPSESAVPQNGERP